MTVTRVIVAENAPAIREVTGTKTIDNYFVIDDPAGPKNNQPAEPERLALTRAIGRGANRSSC